jgi:hypothetical protein
MGMSSLRKRSWGLKQAFVEHAFFEEKHNALATEAMAILLSAHLERGLNMPSGRWIARIGLGMPNASRDATPLPLGGSKKTGPLPIPAGLGYFDPASRYV